MSYGRRTRRPEQSEQLASEPGNVSDTKVEVENTKRKAFVTRDTHHFLEYPTVCNDGLGVVEKIRG